MAGRKRNKISRALATADRALHRKGVVTAVYLLLRFVVVVTMVLQFLNGNFENVFLCLLTLVLFLLPTIIERALRIDLPNTLEIIILLFIFAAEILGEIRAYYTTYQGWDTMLHTLNGFLCAAIGFALVDLFNRNERFSLSLSPVYMAIAAFCFSMTIGVLWEFFECLMDQMFLLDMQKDAVIQSISSVMLDPTGGNHPVAIRGITDVIVVTEAGEETFDLEEFEGKLEEVLSQVEGAGETQVVLTLAGGSRRVLAQDQDRDGDGGVASATVTVGGGAGGQEVVTLQTMAPSFRGALVVCPGGGDAQVRLELIRAVSALTGLGSDSISVCRSDPEQQS